MGVSLQGDESHFSISKGPRSPGWETAAPDKEDIQLWFPAGDVLSQQILDKVFELFILRVFEEVLRKGLAGKSAPDQLRIQAL